MNLKNENLKNKNNNDINNDKFRNVVNKPAPISKDEIQTVKFLGEGNFFYRCLSFFYYLMTNIA